MPVYIHFEKKCRLTQLSHEKSLAHAPRGCSAGGTVTFANLANCFFKRHVSPNLNTSIPTERPYDPEVIQPFSSTS